MVIIADRWSQKETVMRRLPKARGLLFTRREAGLQALPHQPSIHDEPLNLPQLHSPEQMPVETINQKGRIIILVVAFLGWFFGGVQTGLTNLGRPAAEGLLDLAGWAEGLEGAARGKLIDRWASYLQCAFLFGAAVGGWIFGRLGDRIRRTRALGLSIIWFSAFTGLASFARDPSQLFAIRFIACLGVGGCWPNGVALVSEAWSNFARPIMASMIGMAGNIGIFFGWLPFFLPELFETKVRATGAGVSFNFGRIFTAATIFRKTRAHGVGAGIHFWGTEDEHVRFLNMGANILIHKADIILFRTHLQAELTAIRARVGDQAANQKGGAVSI
ncbi:MAG: MFS transporter [Verrucomicrobiales bacterium]